MRCCKIILMIFALITIFFLNSSLAFAKTKENTTIKPITSPKKIVLGFSTYYYPGDNSSYNSMLLNASSLDEVATDTFTTDGYGNISGLIPIDQINYANNVGIKSLVMISNSFNKDIAKTLLENPINLRNLINNILNSIQTYGYKGVNIDLENIYYYDRKYLTTFMCELYNTLNPKGYYISIDVPAKTHDNLTDSWAGAYDYTALSKYSDQVIIMTYDEHYSGGEPGPIASIGWVENVIQYAVAAIPREKLLLGTAAYGYDWPETGQKAKAYGVLQNYNLASTYGVTIKWDYISQSPYFTYIDETGIKHNVWFENAQSLNYKLNLVNSYNLSGIAIWRLGFEDNAYWTSIRTKFNK